MTVSRVEVLVEEPSMEAALRILLPRLLGRVRFQVYPHQCKQDLLGKLPDRLRGYASWLPKDWRIVVVVDRDDDSCRELKQHMEQAAFNAGLRTRSASGSGDYALVNRIAIEELEAWYFGDWRAVKSAFPRAPAGIPRKRRYRNADAVPGGTWEAFERVLQRAGYYRNGLRKIEAARAVAQHWQPANNTSMSFQAFRDVLLEIATA